MTTKDEREPFLSRWSRLKQEAREEPTQKEQAAPDGQAPAPELPPVDQLNHDSDFKGFMDKRVDDKLRRLALKKLFTDPRFNVTDGLDDYAEDYTLLEDLPAGMAALQQHARSVLRGPEPDEQPATEEPAGSQQEEQPSDQVASRSNERPDEEGGGSARADDGARPASSGEKQEGQG